MRLPLSSRLWTGVLCLGLTACSLRSTYITTAYPVEFRTPPGRSTVLQAASSLYFSVQRTYAEEPAVGACMQSLANPEVANGLWGYGKCIESPPVPSGYPASQPLSHSEASALCLGLTPIRSGEFDGAVGTRRALVLNLKSVADSTDAKYSLGHALLADKSDVWLVIPRPATNDWRLGQITLLGAIRGPPHNPYGGGALALKSAPRDRLSGFGVAEPFLLPSLPKAPTQIDSKVLGCPGLGRGDAPVLVEAMLASGEAMVAFDRDLYGDLSAGRTMPTYLKDAWVEAAKGTADVLTRTPDARRGQTRGPSIALSGGAANGAFIAGYLRMTMAALERVRMLAGEAPPRAKFELAATTSAGTLVALAFDLFSVSPDRTPTQPEAEGLNEYLHEWQAIDDSNPVKPAKGKATWQTAAIGLLDGAFGAQEPELFCSERSGPFGAVGLVLDAPPIFKPRRNLLRFDELYKRRINDFFGTFSDAVTTNRFIRVSMAAEIQNNLLLPLDERVCRAAPDADAKVACLVSQVAASITEPTYARPVSRVWTPFPGEPYRVVEGDWLDGGIRSGTPALTALRMSPPGMPVLAVSSNRSEGIPKGPEDTGFAILLESLGDLIEQTRTWEIASAPLFRRDQDAQLLVASAWLTQSSREKPPVGIAVSAPETQLGPALLSVFVPEDEVQFPLAVAAGGYTFDPNVTQSLYAWGEITALRQLESQWAVLGVEVKALPEELLQWRDSEVELIVPELKRDVDLIRARQETSSAWRSYAKQRQKWLRQREGGLGQCGAVPLGDAPAKGPSSH